jgi:hypothetical protein
MCHSSRRSWFIPLAALGTVCIAMQFCMDTRVGLSSRGLRYLSQTVISKGMRFSDSFWDATWG